MLKFITYPFHRGRFIILFLFTFQLQAQTDSCRILANDLKEFKERQTITMSNLQMNLRKHSEIHNIGTGFQVAGIGIMFLSIPMQESFPESASGAIIAGGAVAIIGTIITIVSHKFIGRAGGK